PSPLVCCCPSSLRSPMPPPQRPPLFPYTTLFRSSRARAAWCASRTPGSAATSGSTGSRPTPGRSSSIRRSHGSEQRTRWSRRSEEHTSELQSRFDLVCRLLLEKKKIQHSIVIADQQQKLSW